MQRQRKEDIELQDLSANREEALATNRNISMTVGFFDSLDLAAIFTMFLRPFLHKFLEETGKYFMFPIAAGSGLIQAGLKWWQAYLDGGKPRTIAEASIETVAGIGITVAVVGALALPLIFGSAVPLIFTSMVAGRTLWNAGSAIFYLVKAIKADTPEKRKENLQKFVGSTVATVAGILATAAVTTVFLFAHAAMAPLGIVAGAIAVGYIAFSAIKIWRDSRKKKQLAQQNEHAPLLVNGEENRLTSAPRLTNGAGLAKTLGSHADEVRRNPVAAPAPAAPKDADSSVKVSRSGSLGLLPAPRRLPQPGTEEKQARSGLLRQSQ